MSPFFIIFLICGVLTASSPAFAANSDDGFAYWIQNLEADAVAQGISEHTVYGALNSVFLDDRVIALDQRQPEGTATFDDYNRRILSDEMVQKGRDVLDGNSDILKAISKIYGVSPQIIVALWGIESRYGKNIGKYNVVDSLVTLAYEGRRSAFFRGELMNALRIIDQDHIPSSSLRGSWAGAMGQCQFMPSTYLKYAVDYDGDGRRDIWKSDADVFASIARYIAAEGWSSDLTWGREVQLTQSLDSDEIGLDHGHSLIEWQGLGVRNLDGDPLPTKDLRASLIQPDGADGRSFLVYDNYRALMRWNRSTYFATTVGLLADRLR